MNRALIFLGSIKPFRRTAECGCVIRIWFGRTTVFWSGCTYAPEDCVTAGAFYRWPQ